MKFSSVAGILFSILSVYKVKADVGVIKPLGENQECDTERYCGIKSTADINKITSELIIEQTDRQCCNYLTKTCGETDEFCDASKCINGDCNPSVSEEYIDPNIYSWQCAILLSQNKCDDRYCKCEEGMIRVDPTTLEPLEAASVDDDNENEDSDADVGVSDANCPTDKCSKDCPCPDGQCCSQWGYCGVSEAHCGAGCQSGACLESDTNKDNEKCKSLSSGQCNEDCPCAKGYCCSKWGSCGKTEDYCGANCISGECLNAAPTSTTNAQPTKVCTDKCGPDCLCPNSQCCSKWGYCGVSEVHCGDGCQSGPCLDPSKPKETTTTTTTTTTKKSTTTTKKSTTTTKKSTTTSKKSTTTTTTKKAEPTKVCDLCGPDCPCPEGQCCSQWGYCGVSEAHCGTGCQNGPCLNSPIKTTTTTTSNKKTTTTSKKATTSNSRPTSIPSVGPNIGRAGIVMYLTNWSIYQRMPIEKYRNFDYSGIDVINYAFFNVNAEGQIVGTDSWADFEIGSYSANPHNGLVGLINDEIKPKFPNLRTVVSLGGWTLSGQFSIVAASAAKRKVLCNNIVEFLQRNHFDGVDIDWEYPGGGGLDSNHSSSDDAKNYYLLLKEIREAIGEDALLTVAQSANPAIYGEYLVPISEVVDWVNIMAYDMAGSWCPYTGFNAPFYVDRENDKNNSLSVAEVVDDYLNRGFPADRLALGLAFYGKSWRVGSSTNLGLYQSCKGDWGNVEGTACNPIAGDSNDAAAPTGTWAYYNLRKQGLLGSPVEANAPYIRKFWDIEQCPSLFNSQTNVFIGYDDVESFKVKIKFASDKGLAGIMAWELSQDYENELLNTMVSEWYRDDYQNHSKRENEEEQVDENVNEKEE